MSELVINSAEALQNAIGDMRSKFQQYKFLRVKIKTGRDRTLDANAVTHVWYGQIAREQGDTTPADVKAYCKLHFGVPILLAEEPEFAEMYLRLIKNRFSYEEKLELMKRLPVTSLMTTPQLNLYRDIMQAEFARQSIVLEYRDEQ